MLVEPSEQRCWKVLRQVCSNLLFRETNDVQDGMIASIYSSNHPMWFGQDYGKGGDPALALRSSEGACGTYSYCLLQMAGMITD